MLNHKSSNLFLTSVASRKENNYAYLKRGFMLDFQSIKIDFSRYWWKGKYDRNVDVYWELNAFEWILLSLSFKLPARSGFHLSRLWGHFVRWEIVDSLIPFGETQVPWHRQFSAARFPERKSSWCETRSSLLPHLFRCLQSANASSFVLLLNKTFRNEAGAGFRAGLSECVSAGIWWVKT